jgi:hypothetical protein
MLKKAIRGLFQSRKRKMRFSASFIFNGQGAFENGGTSMCRAQGVSPPC